MSRLASIPPLPGSGSFEALIALLNNKPEFEQRYALMETLRSQVNELIETHCKVEDAAEFVAQARDDRQEAARQKAKTVTDRDGILIEARAQAKRIVDDAEDAVKRRTEAVQKREDAVKALEQGAEATMAEAQRLKKDSAEAIERADKARHAADATRDDLNARIAAADATARALRGEAA